MKLIFYYFFIENFKILCKKKIKIMKKIGGLENKNKK
jgi:hypothetical protein